MALPSEDLPNLGLLIKLMRLTASDNDSEALLAIRKANEQLSKFGGDWERLLLGKVTVIGDPFLGSSIPTPPSAQPSYNRPSTPSRPAPSPPPQPAPPPPQYQPQAAPQQSYTNYPRHRTTRRKFPPKPTLSDILNSI